MSVNYVVVATKSKSSMRVSYIDRCNNEVDALFEENNIPFTKTCYWDRGDYQIVMVKFKREYENKVYAIMTELDNKLIIKYGQEYINKKDETIGKVIKEIEKQYQV